MAITDLTGTTWCLNHELNISENEVTYNINFTSDGSDLTSFTLLIEDYNGQTDRCLIVNGTYWYDAIAYAHNWLRYTRRVWVITGGTDSTNQSLINWLQNNATQVYVTSLLNTQWVISDTPETYVEFSWSGTETAISAALDFNVLSNEDTIYHNLTWQTSTELRYYRSTTAVGSNYLTAYSSNWVDDGYRYINITGGNDVSSSFICAWFQTNAIPYVKPVEYVDKVSLASGDEYYIKDTVSGYLTKEDILSSGSISISETSEGRLSINDASTGIAGRFIRFRVPTPTITNLTNTMWALKSDSELAGASISTTNSFNVNFTAEYGEYVGIIFSPSSSSSNVLKIGLNYDSEYTEWVYDGAWYNNDNSYRVILINSGDDVSNSELISLLSRYAYQINIDVTSSADVILEFNSTLNFYNLASGAGFNASCTTYDGSSWSYINIVDGGLSYSDGDDSVSQIVYNSSSGWVDEIWRRITISNINRWSHDHITGDLWWAILNSTVVS